MSGERVATARREAGLTQKQLADRLGVSLWNVERMEGGQEDALARLDALVRATGKPRDWFATADIGRDHEDAAAAPEIDRANVLIVCWAIILLVCVRFFSEVIPLLPRAVNFIDIPIFIALVLAAVLLPSTHARLDRSPALVFLLPALAFLMVCAFAIMVNPGRVATGPALVFMYGYLAPVGVYFAVYRLWPVGAAMSLSRLFVGLTLLQLAVVATISLPRSLAEDNPDLVSGTFGTNAYQLVFFLLVAGALLAGIFTFEPQRRVAKWVPVLFAGMLATVFLAQYRALILTTAVTLLLLGLLLGTVKIRGLVLGLGVIAIFVGTLSFTAQSLPGLNLAPAVKAFTSNPGQMVIERIRALDHLAHLYTDHPRYMLTGTGTRDVRQPRVADLRAGRQGGQVERRGKLRADVHRRQGLPHRRIRHLHRSAGRQPAGLPGVLRAQVSLLGLLVPAGRGRVLRLRSDGLHLPRGILPGREDGVDHAEAGAARRSAAGTCARERGWLLRAASDGHPPELAGGDAADLPDMDSPGRRDQGVPSSVRR